MIAARSTAAVRPLFFDRPLGFDPRWIVRHARLCAQPAAALAAPRYIGGTLSVLELRAGERLGLTVDGTLHVVATEGGRA